MNRFTIRDIEVLTGVKQHTLRVWEQRYNLPQPKRTATNIRYYDGGDLKLLLNVSMLNRLGIKISKITCLSEPEIEKMILSYMEKDEHDIVLMESLITAMLKLDEVGFEKFLSKQILHHGLEKTMLNVVFPFMKRIGVLWLSGSINPAYEHFITNLIRQKLFVAIDSQHNQLLPQTKKFVLFLPAGEPHELGLLFANYLIRTKGNHSLYLGQNLPVNDLPGINNVYKADVVVSVLTTTLKLKSIQEFIKGLSEKFPQAKIVLSGSQLLNRGLIIPRNVLVIEDFDRFIYFLDRLE